MRQKLRRGARAAKTASEAAARRASEAAKAAGDQARAEVTEATAFAADRAQGTVELELEVESLRSELRKADRKSIELERRANEAEARAHTASLAAASSAASPKASSSSSSSAKLETPSAAAVATAATAATPSSREEARRLERLLHDTKQELDMMQSLVAAARLRSLLRIHRGHALARAWGSWTFAALSKLGDVDVKAYSLTKQPPATAPPIPPPAQPTDARGNPLIYSEAEHNAALLPQKPRRKRPLPKRTHWLTMSPLPLSLRPLQRSVRVSPLKSAQRSSVRAWNPLSSSLPRLQRMRRLRRRRHRWN